MQTPINRLSALFVLVSLFIQMALCGELIPHLNIIQEKPDFPGYMYRPNDDKTHPAILLLHGSEGGNGDFWYEPGQKPQDTGENSTIPFMARYYAMQGYVTLALCYFDCKHHQGFKSYPPDDLKDVDLKAITYQALRSLKNSKHVSNKKIAVWGASRGAEHAIVLLSQLNQYKKLFPVQPDAVIALSPIDFVGFAFPLHAAQAVIHGLPFPMDGKSSPWKFGQSLRPQMPVQLGQTQTPLLVTYFSVDPVWQAGNVENLAKQFTSQVKRISVRQFDPASLHIDNALGNLKGRTFLKFDYSGHVFPDYGSESSLLQNKVIEEFLKTNLK